MGIKPLHVCEVQLYEAVISKDACAPSGSHAHAQAFVLQENL